MACGKCGEAGHYTKTCGRAPKVKSEKPAGAKRGARSRPGLHVVPAGTPVLPGGSVIEQLVARAGQLRDQLKDTSRLQRELETVEKVIKELRSIEGAA